MWLPEKTFDLFRISKDTVDNLREDLASVRAERDALQAQLSTTQANFNWLCVRVNSLEAERAQLLKVAYNINIPIPEVVRQPSFPMEFNSALFDDLGDDEAKKQGYPVYGN